MLQAVLSCGDTRTSYDSSVVVYERASLQARRQHRQQGLGLQSMWCSSYRSVPTFANTVTCNSSSMSGPFAIHVDYTKYHQLLCCVWALSHPSYMNTHLQYINVNSVYSLSLESAYWLLKLSTSALKIKCSKH